MQARERYPSVKPFLPHALAATAAVVALPIAVVYGLMVGVEPNPPTWVLAALGVFISLGVSVAGTALWLRRPAASFIGFSDLMLPRWLRRLRAEKQLSEGARLLGLDRSGKPVEGARVSPQEQLQVLKDLNEALEAKDPYTSGHSRRVERHAYRTAAAMGLSATDLEDVRKAAALHDVGKIRIPDRILRKDGALTIEERAMIQEHAVVGAYMVSSVGNADVISAVRHHHEHWDGTGYPDGLHGTQIPLFARIISVADTYDALVSSRPYRPGVGRADAVDLLRAESGRQFDPQVVEFFISALPTRVPVAAGLLVALAGPGRVMRELFAWFRRFGAGSVSPAIGATGAAVVLGASVFTPPAAVERPQPRPQVAEIVTEDDDSTQVLGIRMHRDRPERRKVSQPKPPAPEQVTLAALSKPALGAPDTATEAATEPTREPRPSTPAKEQPEPQPQPTPTSRNPNDDNDGCIDGDAGAGNDWRCGSSEGDGHPAKPQEKDKGAKP